MDYSSIIEDAGRTHNVDPALLTALMGQESAGNPGAISPKGASGLMQLMPATARSLGVTNIQDPAQNIHAGAKYLSQQLDKYGTVPLALAAYNAGPGAVDKHGGIPPYPETQNYVKKITANYQPQGKPMADSVDPFTDLVMGNGQPAQAEAAPQATVDPFAGLMLPKSKSKIEYIDDSNNPNAAPAPGMRVEIGGVSKNPAAADTVDPFAGLMLPKDNFSKVDPTEGMSGGEKFMAGVSMGGSKMLHGLGQMVGAYTPEEMAQFKRDNAPLEATGMGQFGSGVAQAAITAPLMLIPGANTLLGAAGIGAATAGLTTPGDFMERAKSALFGGAGGAAGVGIGNGISKAISSMASKNAAAKVANVGIDSAAVNAKQAGYVIPPADTNPTMINELLNGLSGKIKTAQVASATNQPITNKLAASAVGAPVDEQLSREVLGGIRKQAGQSYDAVGSVGMIRPTQAYDDALNAITAPYKAAAQGFPNDAPSPIIKAIEGLKTTQFDAGSAIAKTRQLRASADSAYRAGDAETGKALKSASNAIEDAIDAHLVSTGAPADLLKNFREARTQIAKTYSVEKALNDVTGNVNAGVLGKQLEKGKPLTGDLLTIGQAAQAFPKATQALKEAPKALSPLDYAAAIMAGAKHPLATVGMLARPVVRSTILSKPYQSMMGTPSYGGGPIRGLLDDMMTSPALKNYLATSGGLLGAAQAK